MYVKGKLRLETVHLSSQPLQVPPRQKKPQEVLMTNLIPRDHFFQDLFDFRRDFDQIFNRFLSWPSAQEEPTMTTTAVFTPPMECFVDTDGKKFHCNVMLAGVDPKDVSLKLQGKTLT